MELLHAIILLLYRSIRPMLTLIAILFAAAQLLISRNMGSIESHGQMLNMATSGETTDNGLRWALAELAPCLDLRGMDFRPKTPIEARGGADGAGGFNGTASATSLDDAFGGDWEACRGVGRNLSQMKAGDFDYLNFMYCPATDKADPLALVGWPSERRKGVRLRESNFSCARFDRSTLPFFKAQASVLIGTSFKGADLRRSQWFDADLSYAVFDDANLQSASFTGDALKLTGASFEFALLRGATFENVDFKDVSLLNADLSGADLSSAKGLTRASLRRACADEGDPPKLPADLGDAPLNPCLESKDARRFASRE